MKCNNFIVSVLCIFAGIQNMLGASSQFQVLTRVEVKDGIIVSANNRKIKKLVENKLKINRTSEQKSSINFDSESRLSFLNKSNCEEGEISFQFKPVLTKLQEHETRKVFNIFTISSPRTCFRVTLGQYKNKQKQLLCIVAYLTNGKTVICDAKSDFTGNRFYKIRIAYGQGKLSLFIDNKIIKSVACSGDIIKGRMVTLGSLGKKQSLKMEIKDFEICGPQVKTSRLLVFDSMKATDWQVHNSGKCKIELKDLPGGKLQVTFNGGDGFSTLTSIKCIYPATSDKYVRAVGEYRIISQEYGSMFQKSINEKAEPRITCLSGNKTFPPGFQSRKTNAWSIFDFSTSAERETPYNLKFTFRGNPMTIVFNKSKIYSCNIARKGRPASSSECRNYNLEKVQNSLQKVPKVKAKLIQAADRVDLSLDGEIVYPAIYRRGPHYPQWSRYANFRDAGFKLYTFFAFSGIASETHKNNISNMWLGKDKYDFSKLAEELRVIHNINPDARIILALVIRPYANWEKDYPEATFTNAQGELGYGLTTCKSLYYGKGKDKIRLAHLNEEWYAAPSLYSEEYKNESVKFANAITHFLEISLEGKIVCGIHVCGGADNQFFPFDRDVTSGEDHSKSATSAWKKYLQSKYKNNVNLLRKAWNDKYATFDNPRIPSLNERGMNNSNIQPSLKGRDYTLFVSKAITDYRLAVFKAIKNTSHGRLLVGSYCPPGTVGNFHFHQLLTSPYTDFLIDIRRNPPAGSYILHNKLHIGEIDLRSYEVMKPIHNYTYNQLHYESILRHTCSMAVQRQGGAYHLFDLGEAYFYNKKTSERFGKVNKELKEMLDSSLKIKTPVGVFIDYARLVGHKLRNESKLFRVITQELFYALERSGVSFQVYDINDIFNPKLILPEVVVLPFFPAFGNKEISKLRKIADKSNSTIIWGYYCPIKKVGKVSIAGYNFVFPKKLQGQVLRAAPSSLTEGMENKILGRSYSAFSSWGFFNWVGIPAMLEPQTGDEVLGFYQSASCPGMILRKYKNHSEIINGSPGAFSPQFFRNIARKQNLEILSDNDKLLVMAGNGILSILCEQGGKNLKVKIPDKLKVASSPTNHNYRVKNNMLYFDTDHNGEVAFFKLSKDKND